MFIRSIFAVATLVINSSLFAVGPISQADYIGFHYDAWGSVRSKSLMQTNLQSWGADSGSSLGPGFKRNFQCACVTGHAFA